ncbi:SDR family oxidoreductase [Hydrocarboniphaga sp.]|uniref:SDR family oxidoreductase n=1 Tax=Hydrocarboniphaga sp. TaxID=2033016 RepID=UPI003D0DFF94
MDLGIRGKTALVCGASRGLGYGCAEALAAEGVQLVMLARSAESLEAAAERIRGASGVSVRAVACDVTTAQGRAAALAACAAPDILVTNAAGPPPGDFRQFSHEDWQQAVENNMLAPIALIRAVIDGMIARGFGRIVNITSSAVKAPIGNLSLSNGARAGLTGAVSALARQVAANNVTINSLLPGLFETDRMKALVQTRATAAGVSADEIRQRQLQTIPAGRYGNSREFGAACAYLCSEQASYITAQNWLLDGGAYGGVL